MKTPLATRDSPLPSHKDKDTMSEIDVDAGTTDFSGLVLSDVDLIRFMAENGTAVFDAAQFDGVQILDNVVIDGQSFNVTDLVINNAHDFDASAWKFVN